MWFFSLLADSNCLFFKICILNRPNFLLRSNDQHMPAIVSISNVAVGRAQ